MKREPRALALDAGGTMTDTFIIDRDGDFVVGKAQTTPQDESVAFLNSCRDALGYWGNGGLEASLPGIVSGVYSGTAMLNRLLSRKGAKLGLIVTAGMEDILRLERGVQTWLGYSYSDRLHVATHVHNEPLIPRERVRGVRGRLDLAGQEAFPLYETEMEQATRELLAMDLDGICISFMHAYRNPMHEQAAKRIALKVMEAEGRSTPLFLSSELCPMRGDLARVNTLIIEAYAAEPSRAQLGKIQQAVDEHGAKFKLRVMAGHGGAIGSDAKQLARTLVSGPIGGVVGAKTLAGELGLKNVVCTDIGGTSFDLALISDGDWQLKPTPDMARFLLALPQVKIDSIGAGAGSVVRVNPTNNRIEIGPDSAGSRIGMCWPDGGFDEPTVTDCHVVLGHINPDYFLGGDIRLDPARAREAIETRIARPLGLAVEEAAEGVLEILEDSLRNQVDSTIVGKGYSAHSFTMLCYGGAGPLHVAGYSRGMPFEDILIPSWAAGFSAYGCACADFAYRFDQTLDYPIRPGATDNDKMMGAWAMNNALQNMKKKVIDEFAVSGYKPGDIEFRTWLRMQYLGQLNDLEFEAPVAEFSSPQEIDRCIESFEGLYGRVYTLAARSPELGYLFTTAGVSGSVPVEKPTLPKRELAGEDPAAQAQKGTRRARWSREWIDTPIFSLEALSPGNKIAGPAIVEGPSTTLTVPPGRTIRLDERLIFHMNPSVEK